MNGVKDNIEFQCLNCESYIAVSVDAANVNSSETYSAQDVPLCVAAAALAQARSVGCTRCGAMHLIRAESDHVRLVLTDMAVHVEASWAGSVAGVVHVGDQVLTPFSAVGTIKSITRGEATVALAIGSWVGPVAELGAMPIGRPEVAQALANTQVFTPEATRADKRRSRRP